MADNGEQVYHIQTFTKLVGILKEWKQLTISAVAFLMASNFGKQALLL